MVRRHFSSTRSPTQPDTVSDRRQQGTEMIDYEASIVVYGKLFNPPRPAIDYLTK